MIGKCDNCGKLKFLNQYRMCTKCYDAQQYTRSYDIRYDQPSEKAARNRPLEKRYHAPKPPPEASKHGIYKE